MWNVSVRGKHKRWHKLRAIGSIRGLYDFYLFVLLSLCLAMLDLFAPAAYHPCSRVEFPPRFILGSTSCFWTDWGGSRIESSGAGSRNGAARLLSAHL